MTVILGSSYCRVLSGQRRPELSIDEGIKLAANCIYECPPYAAERNITLIIENHYETLTWLIDVEKDYPNHRCNDGKVDSKGRLLLGTLHIDFHEGAGSLYSLDENLLLKKKQDKFTIANAPAWSPDNTRMYFIDSPTNKVHSFIFDKSSGHIVFEKDVIHIPKEMSAPDGMAIDVEGMLWIAHWGGFGVYRWSPIDGKLISVLKIPVPNVSSCAFARENLDYLIITTVRQYLSEEELKKYPESGCLFCAKVPVKGTPMNKCAF
jgi:sugar lactone lactonase YvrE